MKKTFLSMLVAVVSLFTIIFAITTNKATANNYNPQGQCHLIVDFYKQGKFVSKQVYVGYSSNCGAWQTDMLRRINNLVNYNGSIMDSNAIY